MLISEDIKLDYSDVLIRPKRSTLTSRYDVDMKRTYKFVHSREEWTGVPITLIWTLLEHQRCTLHLVFTI